MVYRITNSILSNYWLWFFELNNGNSDLKSRGGEDTEHKGDKRNDKSKEQIW